MAAIALLLYVGIVWNQETNISGLNLILESTQNQIQFGAEREPNVGLKSHIKMVIKQQLYQNLNDF